MSDQFKALIINQEGDNFTREIKSIDRISNADIIDIRPRVSDYTVSVGARSPLEFLGRTFNQSGNFVFEHEKRLFRFKVSNTKKKQN